MSASVCVTTGRLLLLGLGLMVTGLLVNEGLLLAVKTLLGAGTVLAGAALGSAGSAAASRWCRRVARSSSAGTA